ncbi:MAG: nitroreductase family protein [Muribaculaceae bacterium]|nr:nitroreductase family protein [Muribaculaceae bacterium]
MNDIKRLFETRTSVRRYEREPVSEIAMQTIYAAIRNTPTSYNGQQFSVVEVSNQDIKEKLYDITQQKQIKTCNKFLVFCADYHKIQVLAKTKGLDFPPFIDTLDGVMVGVIDASLAMMSASIAAQSCGLGCCCIGYTRTANPSKIAELLMLPKGVFIVCGMAIGVPRETPDLKPKQSQDLLIHKDNYRTDDISKDMNEYDIQIAEYNKTRSGTTSDNDWCSHILDYYKEGLQYKIKDYIVSQGFDLIR